MSVLSERFKNFPVEGPLPRVEIPCSFQRLILGLDVEEQGVLTRILKNPSISNTVIHAELKAAGFKISREYISLHRNRLLGNNKSYCSCPKESNDQ